MRCLIDSNIIGIIIWSRDGRITDANETFLRMVGYSRADLVAGQVSWMELTPAEWRNADAQRLAMVKSMGISPPYEKEFFHKAGHRVPVLVGGAAFDEAGDDGAAFVVDLSDRKKAEQAARESEKRYAEVRMELAHANRVATMGELSASITHEVMQPIASARNNARAAQNFLKMQPPDLGEVMEALACAVGDTDRAGNIIDRIRALIKKAPPRKDDLEINKVILEVIALARGEVVKNGVSVQTQLAEGLSLIHGDRVQLQQVIINLIMNAVQAMSGVSEGSRELLIGTGKDASSGVLVAVQDSGSGLDPENSERLFDPFYTTKPSGMGLGLSICRSIVEAHGGRIWASRNAGPGATVQFTLPVG